MFEGTTKEGTILESDFSVAVFPFLKTSEPVRIGRYTFRSTLDTDGLPDEQAAAIAEIASMLFVKDDLRVASASYAILPHIDLDRGSDELEHLRHVRAVIAYFYSAPHDIFDSVFLTPEEVSLAVFTPGPVSVFLVRPEHHTVSTAPLQGPPLDHRHQLRGYAGLYNFRYPFWMEPGSRLYPPKPHITLNISQNLVYDIGYHQSSRADLPLLLKLLEAAPTSTEDRIFIALEWYNAANEASAPADRALLDLAIAFEALLKLPESSKTERLVDSIALLLGRAERLDQWAEQFYAARSAVAHEGRARELYYYPAGRPKGSQSGEPFGSLMLYGRQVFQLSLATLLTGAYLAAKANLQERFVGNNERYVSICRALRPESGPAKDRLAAIRPAVVGLQTFRFVASRPAPPETMISAVRSAVVALLECDLPMLQDLKEALTQLVSTVRKAGELAQLTAIDAVDKAFAMLTPSNLTPEERVVRDLIEAVWSVLCFRYFELQHAANSGA